MIWKLGIVPIVLVPITSLTPLHAWLGKPQNKNLGSYLKGKLFLRNSNQVRTDQAMYLGSHIWRWLVAILLESDYFL